MMRASGGVGAYAVQIARAMGADVTGVASAQNMDLMRDLGAAQVRDYRAGAYLHPSDQFDVILDTVGAVDFAQARPAMARSGVFIPLNFGVKEMLQALFNRSGPRIKIGVNDDTRADLNRLREMVDQGQIQPVIDRVYRFGEAVDAHAHVEKRHRKGAVILKNWAT